MALINCSECGTEVSTNAPACPKCGNPIAVPQIKTAPAAPKKVSLGRKIIRTVALIVLGFIGLSLWMGYQAPKAGHGSDDSGETGVAATAPTAPTEPPMEVTAATLFADYKANEVAADNKYKGRALKVSGTIGSISKDVMDEPYITLIAENEFETVQASFSKSALPSLSKLHKGDGVTVTCKGNGMILTSPMLNCK